MNHLIKENHNITPRSPHFNFSSTPNHWIYDDPIATQILNVINPITPAPERWFCQTFREALPFITDDKLKQAAMAFIKQEGAHSYAHTLGNRHIEALGIDLKKYQSLMNWVFQDIIGTHPFGYKLKHPKLKMTWLKTRLAMVAAAEHLTGTLGNWILNANTLALAPIDEEMLRLLKWHGAEEVEHREVAYAMFRHLSDSDVLKIIAAFVVFPLFLILAYKGVLYLVKHDQHLPYRFRIKDYFRVARQERAPNAEYVLGAILRYFNPQYDPVHEGSTEQALAFLKAYAES